MFLLSWFEMNEDTYMRSVSLLQSGSAISRNATTRHFPSSVSLTLSISVCLFQEGEGSHPPDDLRALTERRRERRARKEGGTRGGQRRGLWERKEAEEVGGSAVDV